MHVKIRFCNTMWSCQLHMFAFSLDWRPHVHDKPIPWFDKSLVWMGHSESAMTAESMCWCSRPCLHMVPLCLLQSLHKFASKAWFLMLLCCNFFKSCGHSLRHLLCRASDIHHCSLQTGNGCNTLEADVHIALPVTFCDFMVQALFADRLTVGLMRKASSQLLACH